jgi:F-type H+-transporting ATPase subunit a
LINISFKTKQIFSFYGIPITNAFFTSILVTLFLILLGVAFYRGWFKETILMKGIRVLVLQVLLLVDSITEDEYLSNLVFPLVTTFFIFILTANLLAIFPGFLGSFNIKTANGNVPLLRSPNSDLTITFALAITSVALTQFISIRVLGLRKYITRFINFSSLYGFVLGFFEILSELVKILSFSFRLFGNIFAGEVLLAVIDLLLPFLVPIPFMFLEVFVGLIQAFIFAILTLAFIETSIARVRGFQT